MRAAARAGEVGREDSIRRRRYLRTWVDGDGAGRGEWKATPERGRYIPDALRRALEARDPSCIAAGCDVRHHLEVHHLDPVAEHGETSMQNCCRLCRWHHYSCTHQGWTVHRRHDDRFELHPPTPAGRTDRSPPDQLPLAGQRAADPALE